MAQPIPTHINAFYADLAEAKKEEDAAHHKVVELEEVITSRGYQLPNEDGSYYIPEEGEDTALSTDVSAAEEKPVEKMNREELDSFAERHGVDNPGSYDTKKDLIDALAAAEGNE